MNWPNQTNQAGAAWPEPQPATNAMPDLKAKPHCCEEASPMSGQFYIPCNQPATKVVGWKFRSDIPIRMCEMCADHNVQNRNGYVVEDYISQTEVKSLNPLDNMSEDELLMAWQKKKDAIETAKAEEIEMRKYIVSRAFPAKTEGMNTKELGQGYQLKAGVKYNYNLADNDTVEAALNKIASLGNQGPFIADRLVKWSASFLLTEYRQLQADAEKGEQFAKNCLKEIESMLTITEGAPTLEIKAPKEKKGK